MRRLWRESCAFRGCTIALLVFLLIVVAPWLYLDWKTERDLQAELDRIREAGEPLTVADALPDVPNAENAAPLYDRVLGTGPMGGMFPSSDLPEDYMAGRISIDAVRPIYANPQVKRALGILREAAEHEHCFFQSDRDAYFDIFQTSLVRFAEAREAARWLAVRAALSAADGEIDEALDWCRVCLRLSEHVADAPLVISQLVAAAIRPMALHAADETLQTGPPSPDFADEMIGYLRTIDLKLDWLNAMYGDRAHNWRYYVAMQKEPVQYEMSLSDVVDEEEREMLWLQVYTTPIGRPALNLDARIYLETTSEQIRIFETVNDYRRLHAEFTQQEKAVPAWASLADDLVSHARSIPIVYRDIAHLDLFEIALAAEIYRAQHGDWPADLQALQVTLDYDLPEDPFAGGPYHYRREQQGYLLWSLGTDLDNDGGHARGDPGYGVENCDIVWRVAR